MIGNWRFSLVGFADVGDSEDEERPDEHLLETGTAPNDGCANSVGETDGVIANECDVVPEE